MDRRTFISSVALGLLAAPLAAEAQPAVARIGYLSLAPGPSTRSEALTAGIPRARLHRRAEPSGRVSLGGWPPRPSAPGGSRSSSARCRRHRDGWPPSNRGREDDDYHDADRHGLRL